MAMTGTDPVAGPEPVAGSEAPQSLNSAATVEDENIQPHHPDDKQKEVLRILSWPEAAYYEILEINEDATSDDIDRAFRKKSRLTHTDRNDDPDAKRVFQRE